LSSQDADALKKKVLSGTVSVVPQIEIQRQFSVPSSATNAKLTGTIYASGGILSIIQVSIYDKSTVQTYLNKWINEYGSLSLKLPAGSYILSFYNDAILAGEVKRVTTNIKLNYN